MISAADLAGFQADANLGLTGTCSILRRAATDDGWGGTSETYTALVNQVPCSVVGLMGASAELAEQGRLATVTSFRINIPIAIAQLHEVGTPDRIQIGATIYEIEALLADPSPSVLPLTLPLLCKLVA